MLPTHNHSVVTSHPTRYRWLLAIVLFGATYTLSTFDWYDEAVANVESTITYAEIAEPVFVEVEEEYTRTSYVASPSTGDLYTTFKVPKSRRAPELPLGSQEEPPLACLESMFGSGTHCQGWVANQTMDVVWSWVNSTDRIWRDAYAIAERSLSSNSRRPKAQLDSNAPIPHLQNYDELRFSMRSVLQHFQPYVRQFNLLASDLTAPQEFRDVYNLTEEHRLGQLPQWLDHTPDVTDWHDGVVKLDVHHHGRFFDPYQDTTYSSFGIESQLRNLHGVLDIFVYLNDDMYFLKDLHPADFYTSSYGLVFRFDPTLLVPPTPDPRPTRGEWQPLRTSNALLSDRFGASKRPYTAHMAKVMSLSLLAEASSCFPEAFARTGSRLVRDIYKTAPGDVHTAFLLPHFVIERHREALLWSWAVGRIGADNDLWDNNVAWDALGGEEQESIRVGSLRRDTLDQNVVLSTLHRAGYERPGGTEYRFSSADGYPYYALRTGSKGYPDIQADNLCSIKRSECFPADLTSASGAFMHLAFMHPSCGDCVINRLVQQSGRTSLAAFLPPHEREILPATRGAMPTTLPTVERWEDGQFALMDVLSSATTPTIRVRDFSLRLLARYQFVLGHSPSEFVFLQSEAGAKTALSRLPKGGDTAFACMNDDASGDGHKISDILIKWQSGRWPIAAQWETLS